MIGLVGKKIGMTQVFDKDGVAVPVTILEAHRGVVVQVRTRESCGYEAIQVGYLPVEDRKINRPQAGHFRAAGVAPMRHLHEFRVEKADDYKVGQEITTEILSEGEVVDVVGRSKGRGFQGGVRRHGFRGMGDSRGVCGHRTPGSVGASAYPGRVWKGQKMAGQMGDSRVLAQNLRVVAVQPESNRVLVKGAVPGARRGTVYILKKRSSPGGAPQPR